MRYGAKSAFSLAELLIVLAILGLISAFAVPKLLSAQKSSKKQVVFKETFATMSQLAHKAKLESKMNSW